MSELKEKEQTAIKILRAFAPKTEPYYLCYSGGKDSDVIRILAQLADVPHEIRHNLTTADAPETVQYVKSVPGVIIGKARWDDGTHKTMWNLIPKKGMPPTRLARYCCQHLKEWGGQGRLRVTGVRWAESSHRRDNSDVVNITGKIENSKKRAAEEGAKWRENRKGGIVLANDNEPNRRLVEQCYRDRSTLVNPIIDWTDDDVWEFLHHYGCQSNPLYQCGFKRVGCCICPLGGYASMKREADAFPKFKEMYIKAFARMIENNNKKEGYTSKRWETAEECFRWWIGEDPNQVTFTDYLGMLNED